MRESPTPVPPPSPNSPSGASHALLAAIDRTMLVAQFALDGTLLEANDNFLRVMGYARADLHGLNHRLLCDAQDKQGDHAELWRLLIQGEVTSGRCRRVDRHGRPVWLEATYMRVPDEAGGGKIIKIARDVTHETRRQEELRLLSLAVNATDNAVILADAAGSILFANDGFARMLGYALADVRGQRLDEVLGGALFPKGAGAREQEGRHEEVLVYDRAGRAKWVSMVANPGFDTRGRLANVVVVLTDITHTKVYEVMQRKVLQSLVDERPLADVISLICSEVTRLLPEVRAAVLELAEDGRLRVLGACGLAEDFVREIAALTPAAPGRPDAPLAATLHGDSGWTGLRDAAARRGLQVCWCGPVRGSGGEPRAALVFLSRPDQALDELRHRLAGICTDLCSLALERHQARTRIRQLAYYDALTGLPNRSLFAEQAGAAVAQAALHGRPLAVLFLDLDRFKQVNDTLGHLAGDALLREMAQRLRRHAGPDDICGRLAGDEFVMVLSGVNAAEAVAAAEALAEDAAKPLKVGDATLYPTVSVGIALHPEHGGALDVLLRHADMAMYQAKTAGRNKCRLFSGGMDRTAMELKLREALTRDDGQLHLVYQPQVGVADGRLYGIEALARWHHPTLGAVAPDYFVPLAEECGLIGPVGSWALRQACRQLARWRQSGLPVPAISVNLSPTHFHNPDLPRVIADTLAEFSLQARDLTVELTESVFMDPDPTTARTVAAVHDLGVRLSVDDFGTGYSSLGQLRRLPVDELKLDRSFINDVATDQVARALAQAVLSLGKSMQLAVVAEGVETHGQREFLARAGCTAVQGYLVAPPMEGEAFSVWLRGYAAASKAS